MRVLLIAVILLSTTLSAQTTFAPIGAKWTYSQHHVWNADTNLFVIECVGDTLIESFPCSVLEHSEGVSECMGFRKFVSTAGDSVIFWEPIDSTFRTLYVFGLSPGEGWETIVARGFWDLGTWVVVYDTLTFEVAASDMVVIDGVQLRRSIVMAVWSMDAQNVPFGGTVIERLGHSVSMFQWIDGACDFEANNPLRCYEDLDIAWLDPQFPQCAMSVGIQDATGLATFTLQPTLVATGEPVLVIATSGVIIVMDAAGRVVLQRSIQGQGSFSLATPGAFTVRYKADSGQVAHQRIVVQ